MGVERVTVRKTQLGYYPANDLVITGQIDQTARLERTGTYDAAAGTTLGTRVGPHRIYGNFGMVTDGTAFASGTVARQSFDSGHTVIWSCSGNGTQTNKFYQQVINGDHDTNLKSTFVRLHALDFGGAVTSIATSGTEVIPGSQYGGTKSTVIWWLGNHEPNINTDGSNAGNGITRWVGTPAQFAGMMKHYAQLYDTWRAANGNPTVRIKFAVNLSNPSDSSLASYYDVGNSNDITSSGARPMDGQAWDIYYPRTENSGQGPVTASDPIAFSTKFARLKTWADSHMPTNSPHLIPEFAIRIPTSPASGGAGPAPSSVATWYAACDTWQAANLLPNGNYPVYEMCQYAAASVLSNTAGGGADNSIIPDQTTHTASYQVAGVSLRPSFVAFHDQLVSWGNLSLSGGSAGVTPTGVSATTPAAGVMSATLSWTLNGANASYNVYKNGTKTQSSLTGSSTTIYADSSLPLPQTATYGVKGVGTNGVETALSSTVNVTYTVATGTVPAVPGQPIVSNVGQTTATAAVTAVTGATGYNWFLDGSGTALASLTTATVSLTGLAAGSHTVKALAYNTAGSSAQSIASASFTMATAPDTTAPSVPTGLAAVPSATQVLVSWNASTDTVVAGATTSGMGTYVVTRTDPSGTVTTISPTGLTGTSVVDTAPPSVTSGPVNVVYAVKAVDISGNPSASATLTVTIPALPVGTGPTASLALGTSSPVNALFTISGAASTPGTGGTIALYEFVVTKGGTVVADLGPSSAATQRFALPNFGLFTVTLTVTDTAGLKSTASGTILGVPDDGLTFPYTGAAKEVPGARGGSASASNLKLGMFDNAMSALSDRADGHDTALAQIGDPLTPRRHNNCLFASISPESAGAFLTLNAGTMYVIRAMTINGEPFSSVNWVQVASSVSTVTNSFWAVYDVTGALVSSTTATDCSAKWMVNGEQTYTLDGGPFDPPLGADATDPNVTPPSQEFFLAFYLGTVGATHPQIAIGSTFANAVNLGTSASAMTPTQATIQNAPLFSTAANTPGGALTPPTTLGALTRLGASMLVAVYA